MSLVSLLKEKWKKSLVLKYGDLDYIDNCVEHLEKIAISYINSNVPDPKFKSQILNGTRFQYEQALGEMLLFDVLKKNGFSFEPTNGIGPDFCVLKDNMKIWCELITPEYDSSNKIKEFNETYDPLRPCPQMAYEHNQQLKMRISSAIQTKQKKYVLYQEKGIVSKNDFYVIAVNDAVLCYPGFPMFGVSHSADASQIPMAAEFLLSKQPLIKPDTQAKIEQGHFLSQKLEHISAVIQITLRDDYGYREDILQNKELDIISKNNLIKKPDIVINSNAKNKIAYNLFEMKHWFVGNNQIRSYQKPLQVTQDDIDKYHQSLKRLLGIN